VDQQKEKRGKTTMQETIDIKDNQNLNSKASCMRLSACVALFDCLCTHAPARHQPQGNGHWM
jgi:hypothetical protein